jgi:hypothetical protein
MGNMMMMMPAANAHQPPNHPTMSEQPRAHIVCCAPTVLAVCPTKFSSKAGVFTARAPVAAAA